MSFLSTKIDMMAGKLSRLMGGACCAALLLLSTNASAQEVIPTGSGTPGEPYIIKEVGNLLWIDDAATTESGNMTEGAFFVMTNEIDLSAVHSWAPICATADRPFLGNFNGGKFALKNLNIDSVSTPSVGVFGYVGATGEISDLSLQGATVTPPEMAASGDAIGTLVGTNGGVIKGCHATTVTVNAKLDSEQVYVGGLIGLNLGTVSDVSAAGDVTGDDYVGGVIGANLNDASNADAKGTVTGRNSVGGVAGVSSGTLSAMTSGCTVTGETNVGGIVGLNYLGTASGLNAFSQVTGKVAVGGAVGQNQDSMTSVTVDFTASVQGETQVGGVVGDNIGKLEEVLSHSTASGFNFVGGAVGENRTSGTVDNVIADGPASIMPDGDGNTSGSCGGLIGANSGSLTTGYAFGQVAGAPGTFALGGAVGLNDGEVKTVVAVGNVFGDEMVGGFVGDNSSSGSVIDCSASGSANANTQIAGGFVGRNNGVVSVENNPHVTASGIVSSPMKAGGFVGDNLSNGSIDNSLAFGLVSAGVGAVEENIAGGFVGANSGKIDLAKCAGVVNAVGNVVGGFAGGNDKDGSITNAESFGNVSVTSDTARFVGGFVGMNNGTIDLTTVSATLVSKCEVIGGFVGQNNGHISNSLTSAAVDGFKQVGGFAGENQEDLNIVFAHDSVSGEEVVGGLVGQNDGTVTSATATGQVDGFDYTGGLIGSNTGTLTDVSATGNVNGAGDYVGGLIGDNQGDVKNAAASGDVAGHNYTGGLIGKSAGTINTAAATGKVVAGNGDYVGGLIGFNEGNVSVGRAFANVTGANYVGGLFGRSDRGSLTTVLAFGSVSGVDYTGGAAGFVASGSCNSVGAYGFSVKGDNYVGGLIGSNADPITSASSMNNAEGVNYVGGLIGENKAGATVQSGYAYGDAWGIDYVGGLIGRNESAGVALSKAYGSAEGNNWIGGLIGYNNSATLSDNESNGNAYGSTYVGGYVGQNLTGIVRASKASGNVEGINYVGGMVGHNGGAFQTGNMSSCETFGSMYVGGLIGWNTGAAVTGASTQGRTEGADYIGGLIGWNDGGAISRSYSTGSVSGFSCVAGLIGYNASQSALSQVFATGVTTGGYLVGGLVGENDNASVTDAYANGDVAGNYYVGGLIGFNTGAGAVVTRTYSASPMYEYGLCSGALVGDSDKDATVTLSYWSEDIAHKSISAAGTSVTKYQMTQSATFDSWDFGSTWNITAGQSYPYLRFCSAPFSLNVSVVGAGSVTVAPAATVYNPGAKVNITAVWDNNHGPSQFRYWRGDIMGNLQADVNSIVMDNHKSVEAHFSKVYNITTLDELQNIAFGDLDGIYLLQNDIDASDSMWMNSGQGFLPIGSKSAPFTGRFKGQGHTIKNLFIDRPNDEMVGLFGQLGAFAEISDLTLEGVDVMGGKYTGSLVGYSNYVLLNSISVDGFVQSDYSVRTGSVINPIIEYGNLGGLAGQNWGRIVSGTANVTVRGKAPLAYVGGLVGTDAGYTQNTVVSGAVTGLKQAYLGGAFGWLGGSASVTTSTGTVQGGEIAGGFAGEVGSRGWVEDCHASGNVNSDLVVAGAPVKVGGFVGQNRGSLVTCDADGSVYVTASNSMAGGVAAYNTGDILGAVANGDVTGEEYVGGAVGKNDGSLRIVTAYGSVLANGAGNYAGGLAALNNGRVEHCYSHGAVAGGQNVGGLLGRHTGMLYAGAAFGSTVTGTDNIGGLVGSNAGEVVESYATGMADGGKNVGGLVGVNESYYAISNSYATGPVKGDTNVGGLLGWNKASGMVYNCFSAGTVETYRNDTVFGGLAAVNDGTIFNSYWDKDASGVDVSKGGTGVSTVSMKDQANFGGWDFPIIWGIDQGVSYPYLKTQIYAPVSPNTFTLDVIVEGPGGVSRSYQAASYEPGTVIILSAYPFANAKFRSWIGATSDPYMDTVSVVMDTNRTVVAKFSEQYDITGASDLAMMANDLSGYYVLQSDIDMTGVDFAPIGDIYRPFAGFVDGNGHAIVNLSIMKTSADRVGLFGVTAENCEIQNLKLTNCSVEGGSIVGGFVGENYGLISRSYVTGSVIGSAFTGLLTGTNYGVISESYGTGSVHCASVAGGLLGANYGEIMDCYVSVSLPLAPGNAVGGLTGWQDVTFGKTVSCYWDGDAAPDVSFSASGVRKTAVQMRNKYSYEGWDWNVWKIAPLVNNGYPFLGFMSPTGQVKVELRPAEAVTAGAKFIVGGVEYNSKTVVDVPASVPVTVSYKNVAGFNTPASQTVTVQPGQLASWWTPYSPDYGKVSVTISPAEAVTSGAQWALDGSGWLDSGAVAYCQTNGMHTITFKPVADWYAPDAVTVSVSPAQTYTMNAVYSRLDIALAGAEFDIPSSHTKVMAGDVLNMTWNIDSNVKVQKPFWCEAFASKTGGFDQVRFGSTITNSYVCSGTTSGSQAIVANNVMTVNALPDGTYTVIPTVNRGSLPAPLSEINYVNNWMPMEGKRLTVRNTSVPTSDLTFTTTPVVTVNTLDPRMVTVTGTVRNNGPQAMTGSGVWIEGFFGDLTMEGTLDPEGTIGPGSLVASLAVGATADFTLTGMVPLGADTSALSIIVDSTDILPETDETNNSYMFCDPSVIPVPPANGIDLAVSSFTVDSAMLAPVQIAPGSKLTGSVTVTNKGASPLATDIWLEIFASRDGGVSFVRGATAVESLVVQAPAPGQTLTYPLNQTVNAIGDGIYTLIAVVNRMGPALNPGDEKPFDNRLVLSTGRISISTPAPSVPVNVTWAEGPYFNRTGNTMTVTGKIVNNGSGTTLPFWTEAFSGSLERKTGVFTKEAPIAGGQYCAGLAAGATQDINIAGQVLPGRIIGVLADSTDLIAETDETDNYGYSELTD